MRVNACSSIHCHRFCFAYQEVLLWRERRWCGQSDEAGPVWTRIGDWTWYVRWFFSICSCADSVVVVLIIYRNDGTNSWETVTVIEILSICRYASLVFSISLSFSLLWINEWSTTPATLHQVATTRLMYSILAGIQVRKWERNGCGQTMSWWLTLEQWVCWMCLMCGRGMRCRMRICCAFFSKILEIKGTWSQCLQAMN